MRAVLSRRVLAPSCQDIPITKPRWDKLGHPRISLNPTLGGTSQVSRSNTLLVVNILDNLAQSVAVLVSTSIHNSSSSVLFPLFDIKKKILPAAVHWWLLLSSLQQTWLVCHSCGKLQRQRNREYLYNHFQINAQYCKLFVLSWFWETETSINIISVRVGFRHVVDVSTV